MNHNGNAAYLDYYIESDYEDVLKKLPDIIREAERRAAEVLEPTIVEKREVMSRIKDFIRKRHRIVYGGTALNEALKAVNPKDAIYDETLFSDIEFYSPTPVVDLVDLTNLLYQAGYKYIQGKEAQHEETYSIFVNLQLYCDITYVPKRIFYKIRTIMIDGILYVHPHFMLIDYLRMINDPMNAAAQRWEKAFKRMYKLLKNYPLKYFRRVTINLTPPSAQIATLLQKFKSEFMAKEIGDSSLISGFDAYNFYIKHADDQRDVEQMARLAGTQGEIHRMIVPVPYLELISVDYLNDVVKIYNFLKEHLDYHAITLEEYYPFFQFTNYLVIIKYKDIPIIKIYEGDGHCIPNIMTNRGYMYVSYQYLLMQMMIERFRSYLDGGDYNIYDVAVSNLVSARNYFLNKKQLSVINNTVFGEFRVSCVGKTVSYLRMGLLRKLKRLKKGKSAQFVYEPERFFSQPEEVRLKFDPTKYVFRNTSGNRIINPKNMLFQIDEQGEIHKQVEAEDEYSTESSTEDLEEKNKGKSEKMEKLITNSNS
jgi:hypothetical protein